MSDKLSKLRSALKKYGFCGFCRKLLAYTSANVLARLSPYALLHPIKTRRLMRRMLRENFDCVILWRSSFGYHVPLFQRPQHMARQLARLRCLVIYEVTAMTDRCPTMERLEERLWLFPFNNTLLRLMLMRALKNVKKPKFVQFYSTDWKLSVRDLEKYLSKGYELIYEYVDALSPALAGTRALPKNVSEKYDFVMRHDSVRVVVTAERLRQDVLARRGSGRLVLASNGVDYAFFQQWEDYDFEAGFRVILNRGRPIVCYYGALAGWIDYELIKKIAAGGKYSVVLFGIKYDASFDENLHGEENIFFMGPRDYSVLKYYAREADVLILPFLRNEITAATSPVKLFEYMALHKPIVSTDLEECRRYASVLIAGSHEEFLNRLEEAMPLRYNTDYLALLDREARENDWSRKAETLVDMLRQGR